MNIGIIGAGTIGEKHAAAANKAGAHVRWIVDVDPERGARLAQQCDAKSASSPAELWADPAVDAIVVGTPNRWHA